MVPDPFLLTTNFDQSFLFLKKLFYALYKDVFETIILDYKECEQVDIDASMCMDILVDEFIDYYKKCSRRRIKTKLKEILPVNYQKESVAKTLFSIGTFLNIGRKQIKRDDIMLKKYILGPYAMKQTKITLSKSDLEISAQGYDVEGNPTPYWRNRIAEPDGGIRSTTHDMLLFMQEQMNTKDSAEWLSHQLTFGNAKQGTGLNWGISTTKEGYE